MTYFQQLQQSQTPFKKAGVGPLLSQFFSKIHGQAENTVLDQISYSVWNEVDDKVLFRVRDVIRLQVRDQI